MFLAEHLPYKGYYENHRINPNKETEGGIGVYRRVRPQSLHAETQPNNINEIGRSILQGDCLCLVGFGTDGQPMGKTVPGERTCRSSKQARTRSQTNHGLVGRDCRQTGNRERPAEPDEGKAKVAGCHGQGSQQKHLQEFFISIGARFGRIRKRPKGKPSPQLYAYKTEKLQELVRQWQEGRIDLYFGDETHTCSEGYVPYGWKFPGEQIYIPSEKKGRLNIYGMVDYRSRYEGFTTTDPITSQRLAEYLETFSTKIKKETFVVLDNAKVHRSRIIRELRPVWEKRGLFLFFLPPYSPHLNIAETLWRILKGKWIQPADYISEDNLFYAVNRALAAMGSISKVKFSMRA